MSRINDKGLFSMLLATVLAMTPFVQASAAHLQSGHHQANSHSNQMFHAAADTEAACDDCTPGYSCDSGSCSCYQCGGCSATLLHEPQTFHLAGPASPPTAVLSNQPDDLPNLLYRPPRT